MINYYNLQLTSITNSDIILQWLYERLNELTDKITYDRHEYKLITNKNLESFVNLKDIILNRSFIIDPFEILIISL